MTHLKMCGRINCVRSVSTAIEASRATRAMEVCDDIDALATPRNATPRNASPGCRIPVARLVDAKKKAQRREDDAGTSSASANTEIVVQEMTWGITRDRGKFTSDTMDPEFTLETRRKIGMHERAFNARGEGLTSTPMFARLVEDDVDGRRRRCVAYFDGFYEWKPEGPKGGIKQPYYVCRRDGEPLAAAAVFREDDYGEVGKTFETSIVTVASAGGDLAWLHDRMPALLLSTTDVDDWIDGDWKRVLERPADTMCDLLEWRPVSVNVNKASYAGDDAPRGVKREAQKNAGNIAALFAAASAKKRKQN